MVTSQIVNNNWNRKMMNCEKKPFMQIIFSEKFTYAVLYIVSLRGGADRETTGILMWSKLYILRNSNNKEMVVALMDTQVEQ
jgi:hypothetical protein